DKALNRLVARFTAELEGLVMNRENPLGAGIVGHLRGLLGIAVEANPGIVRADRHNGEVDRFTRSGALEFVRKSGITAKQNPALPNLDHIAVIASVCVGTDTSSPVIHLERFNERRANARRLAPAKLLHGLIATHSQKIGCPVGRDDRRTIAS